VPERHGIITIASVGVSPPNFISFFPFVIAGLDPAIHAKATLANASTGAHVRRVSMGHRVKPGGDE
jgi:hypothetical protein